MKKLSVKEMARIFREATELCESLAEQNCETYFTNQVIIVDIRGHKSYTVKIVE